MNRPHLTAGDWERLAPMIEAALPALDGSHDLQDIAAALLTGNMQMWPGKNCFVLTEICQYPKTRELRVFLAGGDMKEIELLDECVSDFGRERDCRWIETAARNGFERKDVWKSHGYKQRYVVLRKDLCNG